MIFNNIKIIQIKFNLKSNLSQYKVSVKSILIEFKLNLN